MGRGGRESGVVGNEVGCLGPSIQFCPIVCSPGPRPN